MSESRKTSQVDAPEQPEQDMPKPDRKMSRKVSQAPKKVSVIDENVAPAEEGGDAPQKKVSVARKASKQQGEEPPQKKVSTAVRKPSAAATPAEEAEEEPPQKKVSVAGRKPSQAARKPSAAAPEGEEEEQPESRKPSVVPPPSGPIRKPSAPPPVPDKPTKGDADGAVAAMEARVMSPPSGQKKVGKWTIDQLRQTDGIIPLQSGTNKFDSQKNWYAHSGRGTPRNTSMLIKSTLLAEIPEDVARMCHQEVRLQSGTNKYASQKGMVGLGSPRDVVRESHPVDAADLAQLPEDKILASQGIVRLQSGTNKYESQKGMTLIGTNRREVTHMKDTKHPEYNPETSIDQTTICGQMGTNQYESQKGMTGLGTNRRELTKMKDTKHPEQSVDHPDQSTIGGQMGTNKYDSQKGTMGFGQPRWETLNPRNPSLGRATRESQASVPYQMGSNIYASQKLMTGFGSPRDVKKGGDSEGQELPYEATVESEKIIIKQAGWNKGDSQKMMTKFGTPRDVRGRHISRMWELEFPEEAVAHSVL